MRLVSLGVVALGGAAAFMGGCRGDRSQEPPHRFFPDMDKQARWNPQADSPFYENRSTARVPDANVVAFGRASFDPVTYGSEPWAASYMQQRKDLLAEDDSVYMGRIGDEYLDYIPVPVTMERMLRGQQKFDTFCSVCHGYRGDGKGMAGASFITPPANLHADLYTDPVQRTARDGYIFEVIRNGVRTMPGYGHSVGVQDAWDIVMYVRALQKSGAGKLDDAPQSERDRLIRTRPPAPETRAAETPASDAATDQTGSDGGGQ